MDRNYGRCDECCKTASLRPVPTFMGHRGVCVVFYSNGCTLRFG
jgi:hypothetical protein